jgi:hypothetical protein
MGYGEWDDGKYISDGVNFVIICDSLCAIHDERFTIHYSQLTIPHSLLKLGH